VLSWHDNRLRTANYPSTITIDYSSGSHVIIASSIDPAEFTLLVSSVSVAIELLGSSLFEIVTE
jgi:hypothetical protein